MTLLVLITANTFAPTLSSRSWADAVLMTVDSVKKFEEWLA